MLELIQPAEQHPSWERMLSKSKMITNQINLSSYLKFLLLLLFTSEALLLLTTKPIHTHGVKSKFYYTVENNMSITIQHSLLNLLVPITHHFMTSMIVTEMRKKETVKHHWNLGAERIKMILRQTKLKTKALHTVLRTSFLQCDNRIKKRWDANKSSSIGTIRSYACLWYCKESLDCQWNTQTKLKWMNKSHSQQEPKMTPKSCPPSPVKQRKRRRRKEKSTSDTSDEETNK